MNVHFSSKSDEWATPPGFAEKYGPFDLDPAATPANTKAPKFYTKAECGLTRPWSGRVWLNPPYRNPEYPCRPNCKKKVCAKRGFHCEAYIPGIKDWVKKAADSARAGATVVCLLPARTDTRWWHDWVMPFGQVEFLRGRLKFGGCKNSAPFPSCVVVFTPHKSI